jgi:hypothetical protein
LEKEAPDLAVARAGFLKGLNHPDDVPKLIKPLSPLPSLRAHGQGDPDLDPKATSRSSA